MKYDKSKVYTAKDADELKVGSKVIVADNIKALKKNVKAADSIYIDTLARVNDEIYSARFFDGEESWNLAYLVEEPEEPKWLKWTDLKVGDVIRKGTLESMVIAIERDNGWYFHIWACTHAGFTTDIKWITDEELKEWEKVEND